MSTNNQIITIRMAAQKASAKYDEQLVESLLGNPYKCPTYNVLKNFQIDNSNVFLISGNYSSSQLVKYEDLNLKSGYTVYIMTTIVNKGDEAPPTDTVINITIECYDNNQNYENTIYIRQVTDGIGPEGFNTQTHNFENQKIEYVKITYSTENFTTDMGVKNIKVNGVKYNGDMHQLYSTNNLDSIYNNITVEFYKGEYQGDNSGTVTPTEPPTIPADGD